MTNITILYYITHIMFIHINFNKFVNVSQLTSEGEFTERLNCVYLIYKYYMQYIICKEWLLT